LNTSWVLNTGQTSNTSRGFDLIVLTEAGPRIEARPQIQAGFQKLAQLVNLLSKHLRMCFKAVNANSNGCTGYSKQPTDPRIQAHFNGIQKP